MGCRGCEWDAGGMWGDIGEMVRCEESGGGGGDVRCRWDAERHEGGWGDGVQGVVGGMWEGFEHDVGVQGDRGGIWRDAGGTPVGWG